MIETSLSELEGGHDDKFIDLIQSMLQWAPEERKTARELQVHPFLRDVTEPKPLLPYHYADYDQDELKRLIDKNPDVCW